MPIWLRKFTYNKLTEWFNSQSVGKEKYLVNEDNPSTQVQMPDVMKKLQQKATYSTKTSTKK